MTDKMLGGLVYVTYADGAYERNFAPNAWFARVIGGAKCTLLLNRRDLEASSIYAPNRAIFDSRRGAGYRAWKPWAILRAMDASGPDDVIFYHDSGFGLRYNLLLRPRKLVALARERGFLTGVACPQYGPNRIWNRRACRNIMGANRTDILDMPSVQATLSFWTNTAASRAFVSEWLAYCLNLEAIRDATPSEISGEDPAFIEHRHDQAILTNLAYLRDAPVLDVDPATLDFAKSATMVELDLRARDNRLYALLLRVITGAARLRRW